MTKSYQKGKSEPNSTGPKYRTPDHFRAENFGRKSIFGGGKTNKLGSSQPKFNPGQFKIQHKG